MLLATDGGRLGLALLRLVCNSDDYVAFRVLLGIIPGVGTKTCNGIAEATVTANLNYRQLFTAPLPDDVFNGRSVNALERARDVYRQLQGWTSNDVLTDRRTLLTNIIRTVLGNEEAQHWQTATAPLPDGATLGELRDYVWADTDEQQARLKEAVFQRLALPYEPEGLLPPKVRIMTMHGAKGLSAKVVFIPGLEESIFPGEWRAPYAGLILEAARLFYVSVTRARAVCVLSYCTHRVVFGKFVTQRPSRFLNHVNGTFVDRHSGLTHPEIAAILATIGNL